jgi:short-subunit dehydrogenase
VHVVITGASSGIGEALAREYLKRGASLTLVARRKGKLDELAQGHAGTCHVVEADLSDHHCATSWVDAAVAALGPIDVLVNNAGVQIVGRTLETPFEDAEKMMRLNVYTPFKLTMHVLPAMLARGKGTIVDIASMAALAPMPGMFFYNASKAALGAASESLRGELRGTGVHVMTVYPGPVATPLETKARTAYKDTVAARWSPLGRAPVLARLIADGVASRRSRIIYPAVYRLSRHFPNLTRWAVDRLTPPIEAFAPAELKR